MHIWIPTVSPSFTLRFLSSMKNISNHATSQGSYTNIAHKTNRYNMITNMMNETDRDSTDTEGEKIRARDRNSDRDRERERQTDRQRLTD